MAREGANLETDHPNRRQRVSLSRKMDGQPGLMSQEDTLKPTGVTTQKGCNFRGTVEVI